MFKLIRLQVVTALIGVLCGALVSGGRGAISAGIGGVACLLPSLLFACYLQWALSRAGEARAGLFFVGEAMKIALIVICLLLAPRAYPALDWMALVIGLGITVQANFLVFRAKT